MGFHIFPTKGSWGQTTLVALGRQDQGWLWSFFNEADNENDNEDDNE